MKKLSLEHTIRNIREQDTIGSVISDFGSDMANALDPKRKIRGPISNAVDAVSNMSVTGPNSGVYTPGVSPRPIPGERNYKIAPFEKDQPARLQKQIDKNVEGLKAANSPAPKKDAENTETPKVSTGKTDPKKKSVLSPDYLQKESFSSMGKISLEHTIRNIREGAGTNLLTRTIEGEAAAISKETAAASRAGRRKTTGFEEPEVLPSRAPPAPAPSTPSPLEPTPVAPPTRFVPPKPKVEPPVEPAPSRPAKPAPEPQRQPSTPAPEPQRRPVTPAPAEPTPAQPAPAKPAPSKPMPATPSPGKPSNPGTQPQVQPQVEPQTKPDTKTKVQTQTQTKTETQTKVQPQTKTKTETQTKPQTKPQIKTPVKTAAKALPLALLPFGSGSESPPGAPLDAGTTAIGTSTGIARRRMSFDDAPSLKAVAKQITKKRAMRAEGYVEKSQTLGETIKRIVKDKKEETGAGKNPLVNTDVNLKRPDLSEDGSVSVKKPEDDSFVGKAKKTVGDAAGAVGSYIDKQTTDAATGIKNTWDSAKDNYNDTKDQTDYQIGRVMNPVTAAIPDSVKKPVSAAAKNVRDTFDFNSKLPSDEKMADTFKEKQKNVADMDARTAKTKEMEALHKSGKITDRQMEDHWNANPPINPVAAKIARTVNRLTPQEVIDRTRGAATTASLATYAFPGVMATRSAADMVGDAEKGRYVNAAINAAGVNPGFKIPFTKKRVPSTQLPSAAAGISDAALRDN